MVEESMTAWQEEIRRTDEAIDSHATLAELGERNGYSVRWNLAKLIDEYPRHNGHADIIRERIDGKLASRTSRSSA
jgi:hypothetical protein